MLKCGLCLVLAATTACWAGGLRAAEPPAILLDHPDAPPAKVTIPLKLRLVDPSLIPAIPAELQNPPSYLIPPPPNLAEQDEERELKKAMGKRLELQFGGEKMKIRIRKRGIFIEIPWK